MQLIMKLSCFIVTFLCAIGNVVARKIYDNYQHLCKCIMAPVCAAESDKVDGIVTT